jgi:hypothetical protein
MRPVLILNPATDEAFASRARGLVRDGVDRPDLLEARLRVRYPEALVRVRKLSGEHGSIWYVYRDGSWIFEAR